MEHSLEQQFQDIQQQLHGQQQPIRLYMHNLVLTIQQHQQFQEEQRRFITIKIRP